MKRVAYGGESFITGNDAADALLEFATSAAMNNVAEVVRMPSVRPDGVVIVIELVIGPSSELITSPVESEFPEPDTAAEARSLRSRISALRSSSIRVQGGPIPGAELVLPDDESRDLDYS